MDKLLRNFKKTNVLYISALLWWSVFITIFGDFSGPIQWLLLLLSTIAIGFLINYRWRSEDNRFFGPENWYAFAAGSFLSMFKLSPVLFSTRDTVVSLTIDSSFALIGWWVIILGFMPIVVNYRELKRKELKDSFGGDLTSLETDNKIQEITGKWWKK